VKVDLSIHAAELPPAVALAAYRIVQEAITNVIKHAGPARVTVALQYAQDALTIEVNDDGVGPTDNTCGHGLLGMRERVALYGGTVTAGPRPQGGFLVRAVLPTCGAA
jgi:signal transduction histidine kinase